MTATRTTLTPNPMYGWRPTVTVEVERIKPTAFGTTSAFAVYADGNLLGYIESRPTGLNGKSREWASWTPEEHATSRGKVSGIYSARSRHDAALPLVEDYERTLR